MDSNASRTGLVTTEMAKSVALGCVNLVELDSRNLGQDFLRISIMI